MPSLAWAQESSGVESHKTSDLRWAVSTNTLTWINVGTINAEGALGLTDHFSINAGFTANPWKITTPTSVKIMNQQYGGYVGAKYWPWHVFSEWWIGVKAQYKNFYEEGLLTTGYMKGDALGAGLSAGYSFMIGKNMNLDLGLGLWGGRLFSYERTSYDTRHGMVVQDSGPRNFVFIDNVMIAFVYLF